MRKWIIALTCAIPGLLSAQMVRTGLYQEHLVKKAVVYCSSGSYMVRHEGGTLTGLAPGEVLYLTLEDGRIRLLDARRDYGHVDGLEVRSLSLDGVLRIRPIDPELDSRLYDDHLTVTPAAHYLTLVNEVDMDKYLAGVVETEAGPNAHKEFYKAQSVLCRTYALRHMERHLTEGFHLCDGVHCQAYKGKSVANPGIPEALAETSGIVAADFNFRLITAAYHSNSGGQTQRASDVWLTDTDYLQSVVDPYSLHQPSAKWKDTIAFSDWKDYLLRNGMESVSRIPEEILYVEQMRRKKHFILDKDSIRMTKIREDWGFRSSFFDMFPEGDSIVIWGKGYGHGVGMSQEGAMKMARDGFTYRDILHFYFLDIRIMDYRDLPDSSLPAPLLEQEL